MEIHIHCARQKLSSGTYQVDLEMEIPWAIQDIELIYQGDNNILIMQAL